MCNYWNASNSGCGCASTGGVSSQEVNACGSVSQGSCCGSISGCNGCYGCGQRICRDACGNIRVQSCNRCCSCRCQQSCQNCGQCGCGNNNGSSTNSQNGFTCVTFCGNASNVGNAGNATAQNSTASNTTGYNDYYYARQYGLLPYGSCPCSAGYYNT